MCSIVGLINKNYHISTNDFNEVNEIFSKVKHRGPDAESMRACANHTILGSNRLAITDHTNTDAIMPMVSACGRFTLVFNGEIYNHLELREQLGEYSFKTQSDTETLLAAYMTWGESCLELLDGMYGIFNTRHSN